MLSELHELFNKLPRHSHPIPPKSSLPRNGIFVFFGNSDLYVPEARRMALHDALAKDHPHIERRVLNRGHVLTMVDGMRALSKAGNGELHMLGETRKAS